MDFKKLGEVATVEEILDTDTVLVARDGQIYRVDKSKVGGGAGGYLLEPADDEVVASSSSDDSGQFYITTKIDDMLLALEAGSPVSIRVDGKVLGVEGTTATLIPVILMSGELVEQQGLALMAIGIFITDFVQIGFTNGGPVPSASSTSTTSVNAISAMASKLHDKPVVEAADGVD